MQEASLEEQIAIQKEIVRERVKFAFDHKEELHESEIELQADGSTASKVDIDEARAFTSEVREQIRQNIDPKDILLNAVTEYGDYKVEVTDSHLYPFLLKEAFDRAITEARVIVPSTWIKQKIEEILAHEYLHAVPALDQEGLSITYGIAIYKDTINGGISLQPYIGLNGTISLLLHRDVVSNPDSSTYSARDKALLDWDNE